jgi:hypothetical protein
MLKSASKAPKNCANLSCGKTASSINGIGINRNWKTKYITPTIAPIVSGLDQKLYTSLEFLASIDPFHIIPLR